MSLAAMESKMRVPSIYCQNTKCKHYFEDSCIYFFEHAVIDVDLEGKCVTFESGRFEAYDFCEQQTKESEK